jgi:hypothetical protein
MRTERGRGRDRGSADVAVLEYVIDPTDDRDDGEAWREIGAARASFLGFHLLQLLLARALEGGTVPDVLRYARETHRRANDPAVPLWLAEGICRAVTGEPGLVEGLDPDEVFEVTGYLIRDLVDVLALSATDVDDLIRQVAATPTPPELAEPS